MIKIIRTLLKGTSPTSVTIVEVLEERLKNDPNGKTKAKELANNYRKGEMDSKFKDPIVISLDLFKTCYPKLKFFGIAF